MKQRTSLKNASNGLVGALAIAAGTNAYSQAVLVTPPPDSTIVPGAPNAAFNWDVNSDGIMHFIFLNRYPNIDPAAGDGVIWQLRMNPFAGSASTNGLLGYGSASTFKYAFALGNGSFIGPASTGFTLTSTVILGSQYAYSGVASLYGGFAAGGPNGSVNPGVPAFAGFRFTAADGTHYGWLQLSVNAGNIDFISAAYNATLGIGIAAGATTAVPEPSTLAMLSLGAAGVLGAVVRRRRS